LDRKDEKGMKKAFVVFRTIDFAKFGRLYLNKGNWEGNQIVSRAWVEQSTHTDPSNNSRHYYNNNWGIGPLKYNSFYAVGLYGQYLYLYPRIFKLFDLEIPHYPTTQITGKIYLFKLLIS
jgi:CubicO group peptidase (beta-lactamase class C family)